MAKIISFQGHAKRAAKKREAQKAKDFQELVRQMLTDPNFGNHSRVQSAIQVEVQEAKNEVCVKLPLPPIDRKSLSVMLDGGSIHVQAHSPGVGRLRQVLPMMIPVDPDGAKAVFRSGRLDIYLKKKKSPEPMMAIPVQDGDSE